MPCFLDLPARQSKPRKTGITHVLDTGVPTATLEAVLTESGHLIDIVKIGWGTAYIDSRIKSRVGLCHSHGVISCLGGTLLELCEAQGRIEALRLWAKDIGIDAVEISNGMQRMSPARKTTLVAQFAEEFIVLAETGAKDGRVPVISHEWISEMLADLDAGAAYVVAEGRESGTVGLYHADGSVRTDLLDAVAELDTSRVVFEAPRKAQQSELVRRFGADVNIGNVAVGDILALETLRLGLRADTAPQFDMLRAR
ncbi:MAG: phosphosulfolactate synthase [Mycobacterium sp.]